MKVIAQVAKLPPKKGVKTPQQVREEFLAHGITIAGWARKHDFPKAIVADLLYGRSKGKYGKAHLAAIALGLKSDPLKKAA